MYYTLVLLSILQHINRGIWSKEQIIQINRERKLLTLVFIKIGKRIRSLVTKVDEVIYCQSFALVVNQY